MKRLKIFYCTLSLVLVALISSAPCLAQTYDDENLSSSEEVELVVTSSSTTSSGILQNLGLDTSDTTRNQTIQGNSIFLRQIGDNNVTSISTTTNASEVIVDQQGESNFVGIDYRTNTAIADIRQYGDNNYLTDFIYTDTENVSLDLTQDGDNLSFQRFGSNSITNSLKFTQTEASPVIIIRSYN